MNVELNGMFSPALRGVPEGTRKPNWAVLQLSLPSASDLYQMRVCGGQIAISRLMQSLPSASTLQEYLSSLPILDRCVLHYCCMQERPLLEVSHDLGVSPRHITRILLRTLGFTEALREAGATGLPAQLTAALESQTKRYLENQEPVVVTRAAAPFSEFRSCFAEYGAN
jgi:hypothetical protein